MWYLERFVFWTSAHELSRTSLILAVKPGQMKWVPCRARLLWVKRALSKLSNLSRYLMRRAWLFCLLHVIIFHFCNICNRWIVTIIGSNWGFVYAVFLVAGIFLQLGRAEFCCNDYVVDDRIFPWFSFRLHYEVQGQNYTEISIDLKVHHLGFGHWEHLHRALRVQGLVLACLEAGQSLVLAATQIDKSNKWHKMTKVIASYRIYQQALSDSGETLSQYVTSAHVICHASMHVCVSRWCFASGLSPSQPSYSPLPSRQWFSPMRPNVFHSMFFHVFPLRFETKPTWWKRLEQFRDRLEQFIKISIGTSICPKVNESMSPSLWLWSWCFEWSCPYCGLVCKCSESGPGRKPRGSWRVSTAKSSPRMFFCICNSFIFAGILVNSRVNNAIQCPESQHWGMGWDGKYYVYFSSIGSGSHGFGWCLSTAWWRIKT